MKRLLIITGPQGSGNHLFSKVFSLSQDVFGWEELLKHFWIGHHKEPFAEYWEFPNRLSEFNWEQADYFVTSISCPYVKNKQFEIPKYRAFIEVASLYASIEVAIIGRDSTILTFQQKRVRGTQTTPMALSEFELLDNLVQPYFLSHELLYLYKGLYLKQISRALNWPISFDNSRLDELLKENSNSKYVNPIEDHWLDKEVLIACSES